MSKSNTFENQLLKLIFNATPIPGLADNAASGANTQLFLALHTADPGEDGNQATNEVAYGGYTRMAIVRTASGWAVTGNSASPVTPVDFPEAVSGTGSATHASIGTAASGAGTILYRGAINPVVDYKPGVIPRIRNTSTITEE